MAVVDDELLCRDVSAVWQERAGLEKVNPIPVADLFAPDDSERVSTQLKNVHTSGHAVHGLSVLLRLKDSISPGYISAWMIAQTEKNKPYAVLVATDINENNKALKELTSLWGIHQLILDAADEGIYGLDCEGKATFVNSAATEILGWCEEDIIGQFLHDFHHHFHKNGSPYPKEDCPIYATLRDGELHRVIDGVFWHSNGSSVPVDYTSTPIWEHGKIKGAMVVFRDITERKEIEAQREKAYEEIKCLKERLEQECDYLMDEINVPINFGEIIGESQAIRRTLTQIGSVAKTTTSVLILGESGVGKEMVAKAIHSNSDRANQPLVKVNCASIPKELFESEFFGHVRGSFTGAHRDRVGRMQLANNGTLLLDEVGEIPLDLQGKLLRALQEHEFERVGDEQTINVDVRIVAASNRDLAAEVKEGRFREDLYYRLSVLPIEVPALRERRADIAPLAQHFLTQTCQNLGREAIKLSQRHLERLTRHDWPGNIRELKNVIERAVILTRGINLRLDLALPILTESTVVNSDLPKTDNGFFTAKEIRTIEKENMIKALKLARWRISGEGGAAELLGIKASTLTYRMTAFGIKKEE